MEDKKMKVHGNTKHGDADKTRLYNIWDNMKERCRNKNNPKYRYWIGRGIELCKEWLNDFVAFRDWAVANGYQDHLTIDRIDNDGNYEPSNCRFVTIAENARNRSSTKLNWKKVGEIREKHSQGMSQYKGDIETMKTALTPDMMSKMSLREIFEFRLYENRCENQLPECRRLYLAMNANKRPGFWARVVAWVKTLGKG